MTVKMAIFANTPSVGNLFLENLIGEMKYKDVVSFVNYPRGKATLKDGTQYIVLIANDTMRGHKFQKAYVSNDVPKEFVDTRIRPSFFPFDSVDIEYFKVNKRIHCDFCKKDVTDTGNWPKARLKLSSEMLPHTTEEVLTIGVLNHLHRDYYYCNFYCLRQWMKSA